MQRHSSVEVVLVNREILKSSRQYRDLLGWCVYASPSILLLYNGQCGGTQTLVKTSLSLSKY